MYEYLQSLRQLYFSKFSEQTISSEASRKELTTKLSLYLIDT